MLLHWATFGPHHGKAVSKAGQCHLHPLLGIQSHWAPSHACSGRSPITSSRLAAKRNSQSQVRLAKGKSCSGSLCNCVSMLISIQTRPPVTSHIPLRLASVWPLSTFLCHHPFQFQWWISNNTNRSLRTRALQKLQNHNIAQYGWVSLTAREKSELWLVAYVRCYEPRHVSVYCNLTIHLSSSTFW